MPKAPASEPLSEEAIAAIARLAPQYRTLAQLGRAVNETLGLEWSDAKWRGLWKDKPTARFTAEKLLGTGQVRRFGETLRIPGNTRAVVVNDVHAPYQDDNAIALAAKVVRWWRPDLLVHNGDNNDFPGLSSKFSPNPARKFRAQDEVEIWQRHVALPLLEASGSHCRTVVLPGNHDARLLRLLREQPDLFSIKSLQLPALWELDKLGMDYAEYAVVLDGLLEISHGTKVAAEAGYAVKNELAKRHWAISVMIGHTHRSGGTSAKVGNRWVYGREVPCLCDLHPEYMVDPNWSLGLALCEVRGGRVNIMPVDFYEDYTCCVAGKWFGVD